MYDEQPVRDNPEDDESKPIMLAFQVYKTAKTYGITFIPFRNLSRDIRLYISQLKNKTYLSW